MQGCVCGDAGSESQLWAKGRGLPGLPGRGEKHYEAQLARCMRALIQVMDFGFYYKARRNVKTPQAPDSKAGPGGWRLDDLLLSMLLQWSWTTCISK